MNKQTHFAQKQRGAGMLGTVIMLAVIAMIGKSVFALMPFYSEYSGVMRSIEQTKKKPDIKTMSGGKIKGIILNQLYLNGVRTIKSGNFKEHFNLKKTSKGRDMIIKYEREAPLFYNIFLLVKFENVTSL